MNTQAAYGGYGYGNLLTGLNPNDIKNIPVLKGSAAALHLEDKIYGDANTFITEEWNAYYS